ncbi:MAG: helix-turn-helix transcriptional regulator [Lachnospiraceae bacterium]|nr:helix-turn-helix transcriptional regulator [Lachnospiraceae bacterium]
MAYAFAECYLADAMHSLGEMTEYAAEACREDMDRFFQIFSISGYASRFEKGDPCVVSGLSGTELYGRIMEACGLKQPDTAPPLVRYHAGEYYWSGYILGYMQWLTGITFSGLFQRLRFSDFIRAYPALHTASEEKAADVLIECYHNRGMTTRLQAYRKRLGLSQKALSKAADVNLRTLQQYEVRDKNINHAAADKIISLAAALSCRPEDLLEM